MAAIYSLGFLQGQTRESFEQQYCGTSVVVQWLGLYAFTAGGTGWIPSWGTKIP